MRQIFDDPAGDHDWGISAEVDLAASDEAGEAALRVTDVGQLAGRPACAGGQARVWPRPGVLFRPSAPACAPWSATPPPARARPVGREARHLAPTPDLPHHKESTTVSEVRIAAESRTEFGKGAARRIRRDKKVPAVLYGHGTDPRHISLPGHELMLALKTSNVLLTLDDLTAATELALPKDDPA